jgi:hypothetical protein
MICKIVTPGAGHGVSLSRLQLQRRDHSKKKQFNVRYSLQMRQDNQFTTAACYQQRQGRVPVASAAPPAGVFQAVATDLQGLQGRPVAKSSTLLPHHCPVVAGLRTVSSASAPTVQSITSASHEAVEAKPLEPLFRGHCPGPAQHLCGCLMHISALPPTQTHAHSLCWRCTCKNQKG